MAQTGMVSIRQAVQERRWDDAVALAEKLLDSLPHDMPWNSPRKQLCREIAASDELFNRMVKLRPDDVDLWIGRGRHFAILRDWKQALAQYEKVQSKFPPNAERLEYACLLLLLNERARYEQYVNQIKSDDITVRTIIAIIAPQGVIPPDQPVEWATQIDTKYRSQPGPPTAYAVALAYYRAGQFDNAMKSAQSLNNHNWPAAAWSQNWLVQAMAAHRMGDDAEARRCLEQARRLLDALPPPEKFDPSLLSVSDLLCANVLLREAEALLAQPAPATRP
jgi:tetratricopeptide (TPR) repeat protein